MRNAARDRGVGRWLFTSSPFSTRTMRKPLTGQYVTQVYIMSLIGRRYVNLTSAEIGRKYNVMSENAELIKSPLPANSVDRASLLAKLLVRDGKSFMQSALDAGYSRSIATKGLAHMLQNSSPFAEAYNRERSTIAITLDSLKPLAIKRLHSEIANDKSPHGMKAIELAGRFKEADWFVRNADAAVGVFVALGERKEAITAQADVIDSYSDE